MKIVRKVCSGLLVTVLLAVAVYAGTTNFDTLNCTTVEATNITATTITSNHTSGGRVALPFFATNITTVSATAVTAEGGVCTSYRLPYAGSVVGISYNLNVAPAGMQYFTAEAYVNDVATGLTAAATSSWDTQTGRSNSQAAGLDTFIAGSTVECRLSTIGLNPTTADGTFLILVTQ